jgi:cytochrome c2
MNKKNLFVLIALTNVVFFGCNPEQKSSEKTAQKTEVKHDTVVISQGKGIGRFENVKLTHPLDEAMVEKGQAIYTSKCFACHKLTSEKLVGPGWQGVTDRRNPEWVMNFITNTQVMLDKDLVAQADLVTCVVRMPNQDLTDDQARQIFEFMRKNDGKK